MIVVDASVAVKWIVDEPGSSSAHLVRELSAPLIAPDLMLAEFANVIRRKLRTGEVTSDQVNAGVALIKNMIDEFVPTRAVIEKTLSLSNELDHSPYDCIYLACAIGRGFLLTADEVFVKKTLNTSYTSVVLALEDLNNGRAEALFASDSTKGDVFGALTKLRSQFGRKDD